MVTRTTKKKKKKLHLFIIAQVSSPDAEASFAQLTSTQQVQLHGLDQSYTHKKK